MLEGLTELTVFRGTLADPVVSAAADIARAPDGERGEAIARMIAALYACGETDLTDHVRRVAFADDNIYVRAAAKGDKIPDSVALNARRDLDALGGLASLTPDRLAGPAPTGRAPLFDSRTIDLAAEYRDRVSRVSRYGYGIWATGAFFIVGPDGEPVPVKNPDPIRLDQLVDYEEQKRALINNVLALLDGRPAANALLTGDAGTGKSSTVKAVVNEYADRGLRIIEIRKEQLRSIPALLDRLAEQPLRFILFIDDLSFARGDDTFNSLKALLEGSVSAKSPNTIVVATSNRRHMVAELHSDREGDEIHRGEMMQETVSLSERFGLHIRFYKPDKKTYLDIVRRLCEQRGVSLPETELEIAAERFALERGGRSARAASQFVYGIISSNGGNQ